MTWPVCMLRGNTLAVVPADAVNRYISAVVQVILTKFGLEMQFDALDHLDR